MPHKLTGHTPKKLMIKQSKSPRQTMPEAMIKVRQLIIALFREFQRKGKEIFDLQVTIRSSYSYLML